MRYRMGDLVELVTETNSDLKYGLNDIVGVTLEKQMIPTIANLTQTNLDDFIIVHPKDFVYNPRTHGKKIGLGFNTTDSCFISTWNNNTFRVKPNMLDTIIPEYLYMLFLRERWDKEACFNAWGSSTVVLLWSSFCDMKINVPPISEQRKIVHDYQVITDRIELLRKMNENLESIGETVYKGIFEAHGEELPDNWHMRKLSEYLPVITGKKDVNTTCADGKYPFFSCSQDCLWTNEFSFDTEAILVAGNGDFNVKYYSGVFEAYQRTYVLVPDNKQFVGWLYYVVKKSLPKAVTAARGSVISFITKGILEDISFPVPDDEDVLLSFCKQAKDILSAIRTNNDEILSLEQLQLFLLNSLSFKGA